MEGRQVLLKELGELLGFEDGAEDVLDHLMTIDDRDVRRTEIGRCARVFVLLTLCMAAHRIFWITCPSY